MGFLRDKSGNKSLPWLQNSFGQQSRDLVNQGQEGLGSYMGILTGKDGGAGYEAYKNSTGYQNIFDEAMRGVSGNAAARGLMASGSTVRGMQDRAGQLGQQNFGNYLQSLLQGSQAQSNLGLGLSGQIAGAGQFSQQGLGSALGGIAQGVGTAAAGGAFSDPDLKTDIVLLETEPDGLGIYEYKYEWESPDAPLHVGVMADEVAALRPHALGPEVDGFMTVNYEAL
jgi:hypothetical protein